MKKFYEFKNITSLEADIFIYGEIVTEKTTNWWTGEESDAEVSLIDFKEQLEKLGNIKRINMYINSPGGEVFAASAMVGMLERQKEKGTEIVAYVDGLSASAASFLMMVADEIRLYKNSIVMIHKPMSGCLGNANEMQKTVDRLNKIEESVMIPLYMSKAKVSEEVIRSKIDEETWFSAKDMSDYFNVILLNEEKVAVACISSSLFENYKHVPKEIKNSVNSQVIEKSHKSLDELRADNIKLRINLVDNSLKIKKGEV